MTNEEEEGRVCVREKLFGFKKHQKRRVGRNKERMEWGVVNGVQGTRKLFFFFFVKWGEEA